MVRTRAILAAAAALTVSLVGPAAASANSFHVTCTSSHVANDDPIVFPGQPGAAHRHEFYGARSASAASTTASLARSATSCGHPADTAAYWTPTLEVGGTLVRGSLRAYYQRAGKPRAAAPPRGLRIIAGDMHAQGAQARTVTSWECIGRGRVLASTSVPRCTRGERLGSWLRFPDCWDGRRLDSPDHASHMARSRRGRCPATHPVELMRVAYLVTWPVRPSSPQRVTLGGGALSPLGMHGDFWNSWQMPALRQLRWDCIEVAAACGDVGR